MEFRRVSINKWPWNDAAARKDMACGKDANTLWLSDDRALLFHITSEENSKAILANGAQAKVCRIGFDGREQQKAFWANCVPIVSHSVEIWMPHIEGGNVCVLGVEVERQTLIERYHFEPSWSFCQFALQPEEILSISQIEPEDFLKFRSAEDAERLRKYWDEHKGSCEYFDTVFACPAADKI